MTLTLPANFYSAQLRAKDPLAGPKHHGSEGRIGPADCSPDCQTSLSEPTIETSSKPWLCLPTFILHSSGPRTPLQGQNTMAVKDGSGPRPIAQSAKRHFLNRLETKLQTLTLTLPANFHPAQLRAKDPLAGPKHHGSEGRMPNVTFWSDYRN